MVIKMAISRRKRVTKKDLISLGKRKPRYRDMVTIALGKALLRKLRNNIKGVYNEKEKSEP